MPGLPTTWLIGAAAICVALFFGSVTAWHLTSVSSARKEGVAIGTGTASKSALEAATKTVQVEREVTEEIPVVSDRAKLVALCNRSASCRERGTAK